MYYYIINPASGFGKINKVKSTLNSLGIAGEFVKTTGPGDATKLTKLGLSKGYNTIIAVGGDSTVNEVTNGLVEKNAVLGVIPTGATNSLAKTLGIENLNQACEILAARKLETIDLGKINEKYFITQAVIGFEANVIKYRAEKGFIPKIKGIKKCIDELRKFTPVEVTLEFDKHFIANTKMFTVIIANSKPSFDYIKTFKTNPQDGILDVLIISELSKKKVLRYLFQIIRGRYENLPQTSIFPTRKITIKTAAPLPFSIDGENFGETPVEIEVVPKKLKVIVGRQRQF